MSSLCACWTPAVLQVIEDDLDEVLWRHGCRCRFCPGVSISSSFSSTASTRCGERLSTVNGPRDANFVLVFVGLVVEVLELGFGGDGCVDGLLARNARLPPLPRAGSLASCSSGLGRLAGISHSCQLLLQLARSTSRVEAPAESAGTCSQMTSISALLAIELQSDVRHAFVDKSLSDMSPCTWSFRGDTRPWNFAA